MRVTKSKRFGVSVGAGVVLSALAALSVFKGMESVASTCVAGILTILSSYVWGETLRPANGKPKED